MRRPSGFSLIELIVVIVVLGIVSVSFGVFIVPAINAHQAVARRAELVDAAEGALRRMSRDIRIAVPNSVRLTTTITGGSGFAIELIPTADGARYCTAGTADCDIAGADVLAIGAADTSGPAGVGQFDVLGCFRNPAFLSPTGTIAWRLVVDSTDGGIYIATGASAVITPVTTTTLSLFPGTSAGTPACGEASLTADSFNRHRMTLAAAHTFPTASPRQRVFVVQDAAAPVTYLCNFTAGTLTRYAGYKMAGGQYSLPSPAQPTDPLGAPLNTTTGRLVVRNVSNCSITGNEASVQASAVVTLSLTLAIAGETIQLSKQVQLDNSQ